MKASITAIAVQLIQIKDGAACVVEAGVSGIDCPICLTSDSDKFVIGTSCGTEAATASLCVAVWRVPLNLGNFESSSVSILLRFGDGLSADKSLSNGLGTAAAVFLGVPWFVWTIPLFGELPPVVFLNG